MNLLAAFSEFKRIYGICPRCGELFRLSEATLFTKAPPPKTAFDSLEEARDRHERAVERFEEREERIREEGRRKGQVAARRRLRSVARFFVSRRIDPNDVKVIFHPIDYLVFGGLRRALCSSIQLVDRLPFESRREMLQTSISQALKAGNMEWRTLRIADDGVVKEEHLRTQEGRRLS